MFGRRKIEYKTDEQLCGMVRAGVVTSRALDAAVAVKEAVLPFARFRTAEGRAVDSLLGPEMRSTGEVMGFDEHYDTAFAKAQAGAGVALPTQGRVFVSVANKDKRAAVAYVRMFRDLGFEIVTTGGTAKVLRRNGIDSTVVAKISDRDSTERTVVDLIEAGEIDPSTIISHRGTLEDGPEFYRNFRDNRSEFTKCVMTP